VSAYPTPPEEANVHAVRTLRERFDCCVGYSDHTLGTEAAVLAVALGARIVEKHFTLDRHYSDFRDHQISADPAELAELVRRVRLASTLLGDGATRPQASEAAGREAFRRSIVAAADLPAGHRLTASDLTWIRPGGGLPPGSEDRLLGRTLVHPVHFGDRLTLSDVTATTALAATAAPAPTGENAAFAATPEPVTRTAKSTSGATRLSNRPPTSRSNQHASIP
jgi:sialic acid synthase SpsE